MYDASNELHEFFGASRKEAVAKACDYFGVGEDGLEIHEVDPQEIYGLGGRTVIVGGLRDRKPQARERGGSGGDEGRSGRRGRDAGPTRERGGRGGNGREGRGGRERGDRGDRGGRDRERGEGRGGRREEPQPEPVRERAPATEPSVGTAVGDLGEIGRFVLGAIERMALGPFEVSEASEEGLVVVSVKGLAARSLGESDGRAVDALQLLANQAAMRREEEAPRIVLDIEGDRDARESRLGELAERAARRARETGRAIALDPMSGRDRRAIHLALRDSEGVATMSMGEGSYRQVIVVPEGAPEYEDAVRESRAAAASDE